MDSLTFNLPTMCEVRFAVPTRDPVLISETLTRQWTAAGFGKHVSGKHIAIGVGSRGMSGVAEMARALVSLVKSSGGVPFIVPAMGSHGNATADGQIEVLTHLGITPRQVGCEILATMDTAIVGHTAGGLPAYCDRFVAESDGYFVINRVKIHTDFHGRFESGVMKMLAVGLGKEQGAAQLHSYGVHGLRDLMPEVATVILSNTRLLGAVASVEDGLHRPVILELLRPEEISVREPQLLDEARALFPRLPADDIDVLIVERMGKEISGSGMDTNILGRILIDGEPEPVSPRVSAVVVLDLTDASHGNAAGIGLADFTTQELLNKIDFDTTTTNTFTSGFLRRGHVPLVFSSETEAIRTAITHVARMRRVDPSVLRVMRIKSTLEVEKLWVSQNWLPEISARPGFLYADHTGAS